MRRGLDARIHIKIPTSPTPPTPPTIPTIPTPPMNKILFIFLSFAFLSCKDDEIPIEKYYQGDNYQTILLYFPWSGNNDNHGLYKVIQHNISEITKQIESENGMDGTSFLCFSANKPDSAVLYKIKYNKRSLICDYDTLKIYGDFDYTTTEGIYQILNDVKLYATAPKYGMIMGCHGMGWTLKSSIFKVKRNYFGGITYDDETDGSRTITDKYVTDISDFVEGVRNADINFEYIAFDDCYMANVEVVYDIQDITHYFIASTSEIVSRGLPYKDIFKYMVGNPDYEAVINGFYDFYSDYHSPYGALAAIDCYQINEMANIMKQINQNADLEQLDINEVQKLDGYKPTIFYDFANYVNNICQDQSLLQMFNNQLKLLVPYAKTTPLLYSMQLGKAFQVNNFSGLTISEPSLNVLTTGYNQTNWYKATHNY